MTLTLLRYLYQLYGILTPAESNANNRSIKATYNANLLFENFINQIEEVILIGEAEGTPYTPLQVMINAYNVLHCTCVLKTNARCSATKQTMNVPDPP